MLNKIERIMVLEAALSACEGVFGDEDGPIKIAYNALVKEFDKANANPPVLYPAFQRAAVIKFAKEENVCCYQ